MRTRRMPGPRLALAAGAIVACAAASGCASVSQAPKVSQATRIADISPVTAAGAAQSGYRTTKTVPNGSCESGSEAIGSAYRCFAGNSVYDPCWRERAAAPTVVCLAAPWVHADVKLTLTAPLPAITPAGTDLGEPWGVQLAGGQRCLLAQGAHSVFRGRVIDFACTPDLFLLRGLGQKTPSWTAQGVLAASGAFKVGPRERIVIAWYGRPDRTK